MFSELFANTLDQILDAHTSYAAFKFPLDRALLRPANDVLDHRSRREVFEVENFFVTRLIGHLEELVVTICGIHDVDRLIDQRIQTHSI